MVVFGISASAIGAGFRRQGVIANNLANSVTTGFKSSRVNLSDRVPGGVGIAGIQQLLGQGPIEVTGLETDLAIEGDGFFMLRDSSGRPVFTRDGTFGLDRRSRLVNPANGFPVQGAAGPISIPIGNLTTARATSSTTFGGNLNGAGARATDGTVLQSQAFTDAGGPPATSGTLLTDLFRGTTDLGLQAGQTITVTGSKGGRTVPGQTFTVQANSTLGDLNAFTQSSLGINTGTGLFGATKQNAAATSLVTAGPDIVGVQTTGQDFSAVQPGDLISFDTGQAAGAVATVASISTTITPNDTINFTAPLSGAPAAGDAFSAHEPPGVTVAGGQVRIAGNVGTVNDLTNVSLVSSAGVSLSPFSTLRSATGEGGLANVTVFDSLGNARTVEVSFALESQGPNGNTFRFFAESGGSVVGTGTVSFTTQGSFASQTGSFALNIPNQGAATPLTVSPNFSALTGFAGTSAAFMTQQDGMAMGTLQNFSIGADGAVTGTFTNGTTQTLSQLQLSRFANPNGLIALGDNMFGVGPNSGPAITGAAGTIGLGRVRAGALEGSNVELTRELVGQAINKSFTTANIKVIQRQDEMLGSLLDITR